MVVVGVVARRGERRGRPVTRIANAPSVAPDGAGTVARRSRGRRRGYLAEVGPVDGHVAGK